MYEMRSYKEVISCSNVNKWVDAIGKEIESLHKNQTLELVTLLKG